MNFQTINQSEKAALWSHSMRCLAYAQFLLYASLYMLLPVLPLWMAHRWGAGYIEAGWATAFFAPAMWIPGAFNSYLIDAFPRKSVAMWGILTLVASTVAMLYAPAMWGVALLRVAQGMAFGIAIMSVGSTLAIDVAPSNRRTDANVAFLWISRMGMMLGVALGLYLYAYQGMRTVVAVSAAAGGLALLCIPMVSVPFRAPLHAPLCTLDRFFLPRAWLPMCVILPIVVVAGILLSSLCDARLYASGAVGIVASWIIWHWALPRLPKRAGMELGLAAAVGGLLLMVFTVDVPAFCIAAFLVALGIGLATTHLFGSLIDHAKHCERGSAVNSYHLLWELGMMIGVGIAYTAALDGHALYVFCAMLSVAVLGLYEAINIYNKV
jgi:hypothetical protein